MRFSRKITIFVLHREFSSDTYFKFLRKKTIFEIEYYYNGQKRYEQWVENGKYHRLDGPAYIGSNGIQSWYVNGRYHRIDGPTFTRLAGTQAWYVNGKRHRLDGPAFIYADGRQEWYVNGKDITKEVEQWIKDQDIENWPFNEEIKMQFILTFRSN